MIPPRSSQKITIPGMGEWVSIERMKKFPARDMWIALVTTSDGKRKWVDSRKIAGWVPFPYEGEVKQLPQGDGLSWAEDWEHGVDSVLRKARRWVELNCLKLGSTTAG